MTGQPGFGEVLRAHRRAGRLTWEQLAGMSGASARTLSDLERGRSKGPQHRTVTALADALALDERASRQLVELARSGRLRDHWSCPGGLCELPRMVGDFTGRSTELIWLSELVYAESTPGVGVVGLITGAAGLGKTSFAVRAVPAERPSFPGGVFFVNLFGMSPHPVVAGDALWMLLRAFGVADQQIPGPGGLFIRCSHSPLRQSDRQRLGSRRDYGLVSFRRTADSRNCDSAAPAGPWSDPLRRSVHARGQPREHSGSRRVGQRGLDCDRRPR
ncbi:helix-turn-helix domain-containing protein [Streptomyces sp. NPDC047525]|uniref:helix-turn-helix domain-containing protein n=1 Tax=Streptomyces sp. NPDC047525 TaxID=3155264 RepID=UPI003407ED49